MAKSPGPPDQDMPSGAGKARELGQQARAAAAAVKREARDVSEALASETELMTDRPSV